MLIGISGKMGSGKDKFAQHLMKLDADFEVRKFAGKLKHIAYILTGHEDQYSHEGKATYLPEWNMTVGELQQRLGTEAIRNVLHMDAWVLALFADFTVTSQWIITDVRFPNEAHAVLSRGGLLVRIDGTRIQDTSRDPNHPSEIALDTWSKWHYRFDNSKLSLGQLENHAAYFYYYLAGLYYA